MHQLQTDSLFFQFFSGQYCVDMAKSGNGYLEGPILIQCDPRHLPKGQIKKCCPSGKRLSSDRTSCIANPRSTTLLPPRLIRDPVTRMTSTQYFIHEYERPLSKACQNGTLPVFRKPNYVLTNGTAYFTAHNQMVPLMYECLDHYQNVDDNDDEVDIIAMTCEKVEEAIDDHETKKGPICDDDPDLCIPKCCPMNEFFHVDLMR